MASPGISSLRDDAEAGGESVMSRAVRVPARLPFWPKDRGLSNKALLERGRAVEGDETAFLPGQNWCLCFLEPEGCREPKPTSTPGLQRAVRMHLGKEKTPNLLKSA